MLTVTLALGWLMLAATAIPLSRSERWYVRVFDFPRIQVFCLTAVVLAGYLYARGTEEAHTPSSLFFAGALLACLAQQGSKMFPYTRLARRQVADVERPDAGSTIKLLFANVLMTNRKAGRLREIIREADPDIILAVEADEWWREQLSEFEETHSHSVLRPQDNTYGMLFYSRLEVVEARVEFLIQEDIPSIHARVRLRSGREVELHCLHPRPPFPTEDDSSTERDAEILLVGKQVKNTKTPTIVLGDLNDVAWSRTNYLFQDVSGLLDPRIGRGFYNTFHASYFFVRFQLDHFFHSTDFALVDFRRLPYFGSDHFPVFIALQLDSEAARRQEEPHADAADRQEAEEKIEQAVERAEGGETSKSFGAGASQSTARTTRHLR